MTDDIFKETEDSLLELAGEELERVAGGMVALNRGQYVALCATCGWNATLATRREANYAGAAHLQNNPGHVMQILHTFDNAAPGA